MIKQLLRKPFKRFLFQPNRLLSMKAKDVTVTVIDNPGNPALQFIESGDCKG